MHKILLCFHLLITFSAGGAVTAKSQSAWCKAEVSGNTVNVNVDANTSVENRSTAITLFCGNDSVNVPVTQAGVIVTLGAGSEINIGSDAAQVLQYSFSSNADFSLASVPDWVNVRTTADSIYVSVSENATGHIRSGYIKYNVPGMSDSIRVFQGEPKDVVGTYYFAGTSSSTGKLTYLMADVTYADGNLTFKFPDYDWTFSVPFEKDFSFSLPAGTPVGRYQDYYVGINLWDTDQAYLTWNNAVTYKCRFDYVEDEEGGATVAEFTDNGSWNGYNVSAIRFEAFSSATFGSSTRVGLLIGLVNPFLQRVESAQ